jgi:cytosine/adenosine deaminase-related metal-dependent hydrolase
MTTVLRDIRPWGGAPADVTLTDGRIAAVTPHLAGGPGGPQAADVVEGRGRLLVPSFSDVHTHLDSTRLGLPLRPHTATPGIWNMVLNDREHWRQAEWPVTQRASYTLGLMIARGTTRVRSYAQVDVNCGLERLEAVWAARDEHAQRCSVEIIAFPHAGRPWRHRWTPRCRWWISPPPGCGWASARTASATTGRRTATPTCSTGPGSSRSPTASAATT